MTQYYKGVVLVLLSALGFGLMPIFAILAYREGANVNTILLLRFTLAALILFAYLAVKKQPLAVSRRQAAMMFVLGGVLYSAQAFLYFSSLRYIPAALTSLLLYTYPFFVALLASVVDKARLTRDNFLAATLGMAGLFLVLGASPAAVNVTGLLMALAAAVVYSAYLILGTRVVKELSPLVTSAFVAGWAALAMLTAGVAGESLDFSLSPLAWAAIAGIVAFATIMAMLTLFRGLDLIGPTRASILSMVEPLITYAFAALCFGERLTPLQLAGGAAVIAGAAMVVWSRAKNEESGEKS